MMGYYVCVDSHVNIYIEDVMPENEKVILFIHGWPANHRLFEYQLNVLPKLGYRCIAIDLRGFGKSDKPWEGYSYNRLSDDIRRIITILKLDSFTLIGHSVGGAIATRYMARHNGYGVSKLALVAAAVPSFIIHPDFPYGLPKDDVNKIIEMTYRNRPQMLHDFTNQFFFQHITQSFSDWFFQLGIEAAGYSTAKLAISLRDETLFSDLEKIKVPTIILHGTHDEICLPQLAIIQNEKISLSTLVWFEYSGHGLFWEQRDKFNQTLIDFIG